MATVDFLCRLSDDRVPLVHFWEHTVGSSHAAMALRADWQGQLARCHRELGFRHVRFHGILSDDMNTVVNQDDTIIYSFFNADSVCDFLLSQGMRPFIELSFMPRALSSGDETVFQYKGNITPPREMGAWRELVKNLVQHWLQRYGAHELRQWYFEVWNEPNLKAFWTGTQADYFELYKATAATIKGLDNELRVGGPATAKNEWITDFLSFCNREHVPVDFISTHHYPTDAFGKPGDDTITQLAESTRSVLQQQASAVRREAGDKPVYYTEWSTSSNPFDSLHDQSYAACVIIRTVLEANGLVDAYAYWTFSDIFEENYFSSIPFHGGFGLLNIHGIPKPAYRAFELLHGVGNALAPVAGSHATVDAWVLTGDRRISVLISNWALPRHSITAEMVRVQLESAPPCMSCRVARIDDHHANAWSAWNAMGSPGSLAAADVETLEAASLMHSVPCHFQYEAGALSFEVAMPPQGVACVTFELA